MKLTQKNALFEWNEAYQAAFKLLKERITSTPVLRYYDRTKKAILETNLLDYINGGVLSQWNDEGIELHPIAYYSKNLLSAECNYKIYNKELLAIVRCLEYQRPELESTDIPVEIFTDHKSLEYFMTIKELSRRQARQSEKLAEYNFKIKYRPGRKNEKADTLTRILGSKPKEGDDERLKYQHQTILTPDRLDLELSLLEEVEIPTYDRVTEANRLDPRCNEFREAVTVRKKVLRVYPTFLIVRSIASTLYYDLLRLVNQLLIHYQ